MKEGNPFLRAALFYAQRLHWPVFPLLPRQKIPYKNSHGCLDATTDEKQIRKWWKEHPNANVAIRTGDSFWVLDIDPKSGGDLSRERLVAQYGPMTDTLRQITGGGGWQYFYQQPEQAIIHGKAPLYDEFPGIDARGENNYIVVPPSIHPTGVEYAWDTSKKTILEEPIQPANGWLLEWVLKATTNGEGNGSKPAIELPEEVKKGARDETIFRMACAFRRARADFQDTLDRLANYDQEHCKPPLGRTYVEKKVRQAYKYPAGDGKPNGEAPQEKPVPQLVKGYNVGELLDLQIARPEMLVDPLLPRRGCTLLIGAQKAGKTVFAAQAAIALATNQALFGWYQLRHHGPVLVIEKDDTAGDASFQDIYARSEVPRGAPIRFIPAKSVPYDIGADFLEWLELEIVSHKAILVVLDSYTALRAERKSGRDIVKIEREDINTFDALGKRRNALVMVLHHESITTRSNGSLTWDARGAGTYGIFAGSESQMALFAYRDLGLGARERLLRFKGRHMDEGATTLRYDIASGRYEFVVEKSAAIWYEPLYAIARYLKANNTEVFTHKDYEEATGVSRATAYRQLAQMVQAEVLVKNRQMGDLPVTFRLDSNLKGLNIC